MRDTGAAFPSGVAPLDVETLRIWHCRYRTLDALRQFVRVRGLEIATFPDPTLESLSALHELVYIHVVHLPKIRNLDPLAKLTSLQTLRLATLPSWDSSGRTQVVDSLEPLAELKGLRHLELFGVVPANGSLAALEGLSQLQSARFSRFSAQDLDRFYSVTGAGDGFAPDPDF